MDDGGRYFTVHRPTAHEGVGRALRSIYRQADELLPAEMADLIKKLNEVRT